MMEENQGNPCTLHEIEKLMINVVEFGRRALVQKVTLQSITFGVLLTEGKLFAVTKVEC